MSAGSLLARGLTRAHRIVPRLAGYVHTSIFINTRGLGTFPDDVCPLGASRVELAGVPRVAAAYVWGSDEPTVLALHGWGTDSTTMSTVEDLDGLGKDVRDGDAALTVGQLAIDEAIVWPQQGRVLEVWATRLREAREALVDDPPLRALVESAATDYLNALADPYSWTDEAWRHHFQPAWATAIAAHVRFRGRRAAMRISREYRLWPVYARDAAMIYMPGRDETYKCAD